MALLRPGGTELTKRALDTILEKIDNKDNLSLLDIGCGDGTAGKFIMDNYDIKVSGVDIDENAVEKAKALGIDAIKCDATMLDYPSRSFDIVMMECVFTVLPKQEESIHEAYCVLKNGGFLVINDVYCREPDIERFKKDYVAAMKLFRRPREEGDCESTEHLPSPFCQDGAIVLDGLEMLINELELEVVLCEDHSDDLKAFAAQAILDYGSLDKYFEANGKENGCACACKKPGYFTLIARKNNVG